MSISKTTPSIRFKGYTDAWEQRKLSELIVKGGSGGTPSTSNKDYYEGNIPFLSITDLSNSNGYIQDTEKHITEDALNHCSAWIVPKGAISLAMYASVGKVAILEDNIATSQAFYNMILENDSTRNYVYQYLKKMEMNSEWTPLISTGTQANLNADKVRNLLITIPSSISEQKKISDYLNNLDNAITLHQRKCEKLVNIKKSLLDKMFPKNGSQFPEIRFAGFTDAWEQRKLSEVLDNLQNNTLSRAELSDNGIAKNVHYGDVLIKYDALIDVSKTDMQKIDNEVTVNKFKASFLHDGDVIVADTAEDETVGKCTELKGVGEDVVVSGLHTIPYRPKQKFGEGYLGYYMNSSSYRTQLIPLMQGIKVTSISKSALQNTDMKYPTSLEEQTKIGEYFSSLDNAITLHQRKLEKLQNIKKSLLDKMFI